MRKSLVVGLAGGSGTGKSTLAEGLNKALSGKVAIFHLDSYFVSEKDMPMLAGERNHDDPTSIDLYRFIKEVRQFVKDNTPAIVVVEGFLTLHFPKVRELLDLKIFLQAPFEVAVARRVHPMWDNYRHNVLKPMYEQYVAPSARYADLVLDAGAETPETILRTVADLIAGRLGPK